MKLTPGPATTRHVERRRTTPFARQVLLGLVMLVVAMLTAVPIVDWTRAPADQLIEGDVATRTVKAPVSFKFQDLDAYDRERADARERELPVFVHQADLRDELLVRVRMAFANARAQIPTEGAGTLDPQARGVLRDAIADQLQRDLRVHVVQEDVDALLSAGFDRTTESIAVQQIGDVMSRMLVADRANLPRDGGAIRVLTLDGSAEGAEKVVSDLSGVMTAAEARQQVTLRALDASWGDTEAGKAASAVARALIRANLTYSPLETQSRREAAMAGVRLAPQVVKRGTVLFREGDTLSAHDVLVYRALQSQQGEQTIALEWLSYTLFLSVLFLSTVSFGRTQLDGFSIRLRNVLSAGGLLVLLAMLSRTTVASSPDIASLLGYEAEPTSVWFVVPVAGGVMLVRLLMGLSWSILFAIVSSVVAGLVMDLSLLPVVFFVVSGLTGASSVTQTHERIGILRAGFTVALVNAVLALSLHFLQLYVVDGEVTAATAMRPVWSMLFALGGGVLSAFMVLGLTPLFETFGFVTDYRLMELSNLNHPLMRQLMLRAPGSYHHSVMVGSLAEAAAEAIGANALQAKVASYFHDIGKSIKPQYFVENQGKGGNRHEGLDPYTSAQIIISHVTEGGRMAADHKLPKPIQDNIWMHHGTGILQYFYAKAASEAPVPPDEAPFRYPGPKPNTREAGIIMLADKVEAATRTIKAPTEDNIRQMIHRIVNSVMADGQFSECPLTFQEIHTIADTFVTVLVGIYHQRIEYPDTANISKGAPAEPQQVPKEALITLDLHPGQSADPVASASQPQRSQSVPTVPRQPKGPALALGDYEAVQHLPRGDE
ncbi:MAG: HDIG domain-containing protein [Alphaproteobacteria bacterium]|nr:HDIG domain-containing protein [Alphaproteobacteria bacterium]